MNFRKVKLDLQTWLTENQLDQSHMQILEGKNLSQDIHMLSSWVKDWDSKTTLVCYSNDLDEDVLTTGITTFKDIPIKYNRDFNECRLVVIGNLKEVVK
jgi:hypothetical protein